LKPVWQSEAFEAQLLDRYGRASAGLEYHNRAHVEMVRDWALLLAADESLETEVLAQLRIASVLHDWCYPDEAAGHEDRSAHFASSLLEGMPGLDHAAIQSIAAGIRATQIPQKPLDTLGRLLCDADLAYLGTELYPLWSGKLRSEWSMQGRSFTDAEWVGLQIVFLSEHRYHTRAAQERLEPLKQDHLAKLRQGFFSTFGLAP